MSLLGGWGRKNRFNHKFLHVLKSTHGNSKMEWSAERGRIHSFSKPLLIYCLLVGNILNSKLQCTTWKVLPRLAFSISIAFLPYFLSPLFYFMFLSFFPFPYHSFKKNTTVFFQVLYSYSVSVIKVPS